jgi:hypothetical protein
MSEPRLPAFSPTGRLRGPAESKGPRIGVSFTGPSSENAARDYLHRQDGGVAVLTWKLRVVSAEVLVPKAGEADLRAPG